MKTKDFPAVTGALINKMKADGYSQTNSASIFSPLKIGSVLNLPAILSHFPGKT